MSSGRRYSDHFWISIIARHSNGNKIQGIQRQRGDDIKHLGMHLQRKSDGAIILSMTSLLNEILAVISKSRTDPANDNLMSVPIDSPLLQTKEKQQFQTLVAKLLYLALRILLDVLFAVYCCPSIHGTWPDHWKNLISGDCTYICRSVGEVPARRGFPPVLCSRAYRRNE